jgi:small subunit ribosomal protein S5|tara:strand:- start:303 stop:1172 length:870 start_codon:yes stop_codon:yes gene_type:complete
MENKVDEKDPKEAEEKKAEDTAGSEEEKQNDGKETQPKEEPTENKKEEKKDTRWGTWKPKTNLGNKVKNEEITEIDEILDKRLIILEPEIVDALMPNLRTDLLLIGQSKGKFGGGQRRVFKQTQKKTQEGNKPKFATYAIAGNEDGYVGIGYSKSKETVPAREKAIRNAKLNIVKISRGCGSWQCGCKEHHSIPFKIEGKCGSVRIMIMPAPKGTGLCIEQECQKILKIAGIKDVWSKTLGQTGTKINLVDACFDAIKKLIGTKILTKYKEQIGFLEGALEAEVKTGEK